MIALLGVLGPAEAGYVIENICVDTVTNYSELIPQGTWWTSNDERPIRGVRIDVCEFKAPFECYKRYALISGPNRGCIALALNEDTPHSISVYHEALVNGQLIYVVNDDTEKLADVTADVIFPHYPQATTYRPPIPFTQKRAALLVGTWMFFRNQWGLTNTPLKMTVTGTTVNANAKRVQVPFMWKRQISHEIGHWIAANLDEKKNPNFAAVLRPSGSDSCSAWPRARFHRMYDSNAAVEGWADFVAAWAWNSRNTPKCSLHRGDMSGTRPDFDHDGSSNQSGFLGPALGQWNCDPDQWFEDYNGDGDLNDSFEPFGSFGTEIPPPFVCDNSNFTACRDWLEHYANSGDPFCNDTLVGFSSAPDWTRFFWNMTTDEGIHPTLLAAAFDRANPRNWVAKPDGAGANLNREPIRRIEQAFDDLGMGAAFDSQKDNGLDHY